MNVKNSTLVSTFYLFIDPCKAISIQYLKLLFNGKSRYISIDDYIEA